jgi:DNA replicative helicase MCM subunit Mcm2 (Cdc46/Mcm family)
MLKSKEIKVSGGNLPDGFEIKLVVTIDYTEATREQLVETSAPGDIIKIQGRLRKMTTGQLKALKETGANYTYGEVHTTQKTVVVDMRASLKLLGLDDESIQTIMEDEGKREQAIQMIKSLNG